MDRVIMRSRSVVVVMSLYLFLLLVRTLKCGSDTNTMDVTEDIKRNVGVEFMLTESDEDEDPEVVNMRRMLNRVDNEVIVVWKFEKYKPVRADITDYSELVTDNAYVILQANSNVSPESWKIFYWVGEKSSEEDAVNVALFAYVLDSIVHPIANFRREAEGQESLSFRELFDFMRMGSSLPEVAPQIAAEENPLSTHENVHPINDDYNTRMILIERAVISRVKQYLGKDDICLVAYNSRAIYVYCGLFVTDVSQTRVAKKLARMVQQKAESTLRLFKLIKQFHDDPGEALQENHLIEEFKRISEAIANEKARCKPKNLFEQIGAIRSRWGNPTKRGGIGEQVDIFATKIYQDKHDVVREEVDEESPITLHPFEDNESYVLDTCLKDLGIVVWLGYTSEIDEREGAVKKAELLMNERIHRCGSRPVTFVDTTDKRIRSLRRRERYMDTFFSNFVQLMQEMNFSWEHFFELKKVNGGVLRVNER